METSTFDDHIFGDFAGPLSPLGAKALSQQGHSVQVMLGIPQSSSADMCTQRLPEVHSLLPGSPKINHYKNLDYSNNKIDYSNKIGSYSPSGKYDYVNGKMEQYSPPPKLEYVKTMEYNGGGPVIPGKLDQYSSGSGSKMDYDHHMQMFQQQQQQPPSHSMDANAALNGKKKNDDPNGCSSSTSSSTPGSGGGPMPSDGSNANAAKKTDKKKNDPNGVKKKKTR